LQLLSGRCIDVYGNFYQGCLSLLESALDGEFDSHAFTETAEQRERAAIKASFMIFIFPSLVIKNRILYGHQRLENHQYQKYNRPHIATCLIDKLVTHFYG
jgi:hypothetical protein